MDERRQVFGAMSSEESPDMADLIDGLLVFTYGGMYSEWTAAHSQAGRRQRPEVWDDIGYGGPSDGHAGYRQDV
jgi:hypothetical protein